MWLWHFLLICIYVLLLCEDVDIIGFHVVYENDYSLTSTKIEVSTQIRILYNTIGLATFYFWYSKTCIK